MKKVYIIGLGIGSLDYMHKKALDAINDCDCLIGGKRMLMDFKDMNKCIYESVDVENIRDFIDDTEYGAYGILVSGDSGFYSLSKKITQLLLKKNNVQVDNISAVGSLQYFTSKLNIPWDDIKYISAHGRSTNIVANVIFNKRTFILTSKDLKPEHICKLLKDRGLGHLKVSVGENLSYENERIVEDEASIIANMEFSSLTVMIVHNDDFISMDEGYISIEDEKFITGKTPMTKREVRSISIGKLKLRGDYTVYDIGAGTGSISIEAALKLHNGTLYAVEKDAKSADLIEMNIEKFKTRNIEVIRGRAPEAITALPNPDACFIGGSGGNMDEIINAVLRKNPHVNLVINTVTLQSLNEAVECMEKYRIDDVEIVSVSVAKSKKIGSYDLMTAQNPIYVISGKGSGGIV